MAVAARLFNEPRKDFASCPDLGGEVWKLRGFVSGFPISFLGSNLNNLLRSLVLKGPSSPTAVVIGTLKKPCLCLFFTP